METPTVSPERPIPDIHRLLKVTRFSKYCALALMVALPFIGGVVGYSLASEEGVPLVGKPLYTQIANDFDYKEPGYGTFVFVDPAKYIEPLARYTEREIPDSNVPEHFRAYQARRLSDNLILLALVTEYATEGPQAVVVYDEQKQEIIRKVRYPWFGLQHWVTPGVQVYVENNFQDNSREEIILVDYLNDERVVLYTEEDPNIQLVDVNEVFSSGILYATSDGRVVFGRHKRMEGTSATRFIETASVHVPKKYLSDWHLTPLD